MILNSTGLVCAHQSNPAKLEDACEDQGAASARGEEAVDIVTPVATILNQTVRLTKGLIATNWQEGQRITYNIFLALSKDKKGLGDVAPLPLAVQQQQEVWREQKNHRVRFKARV